MARLALTGSYYHLGEMHILARGVERDVPVGERVVPIFECDDFVFLPRHGIRHYIPPHEIDHAANMRALHEVGCDRVLAIGSVGSLRTEHGVGTFICPHDFIALHVGLTTFDDELGHRVATFDAAWRRHVMLRWHEWTNVEILNRGIYWQSVGPRLETPAEVRLMSQYADVVGMTIGSECVIAGEFHMHYAAVCVVDNLANGLGDKRLTTERLDAGRVHNAERLDMALSEVVPALAEEVRNEILPRSAMAEHMTHFHYEGAPPEGAN